MNDTQFDNFFNDKLKDQAAPVPAGLWEKVVEGQFDQFIGGKLKDAEAPVPGGLWDKIADAQFDNFIGSTLQDTAAPVPDGLWGKIADTQFDNFIGGKLQDTTAPVPGGLWDKITDGQFDNFVAGKLKDHESPIPAGLWEKVRPEEKDDRFGFIFFRYPAAAVLLLGLLTAGFGGYFYFQSQKKTAAGTTESNTSSRTNGTAENQKNIPAVQQKNEQGVTTQPVDNNANTNPSASDQKNNSVPLENNTKQRTVDHQPNSNHAPSADGNSIVKQGNGANTPSSGNSDVSVTGRIRTAGNRGNASNANRGRLDLKPPANKNDLTTSYDIFKKNIATGITDQSTTVADNNHLDEIPPYQQNLLTAVTIPTGLGNYNSMQNLMMQQLSTSNHTNQFRNVIICPSDRKNHNTDWFLEAYTSPDIAFKSVNNVSASQTYLMKKDSSESMVVSYSAGLRLVKPINNNILLKAGIQYSQVNQKYVYRTENEVKTTTVVTVRTIIRGPGDTVIVKDTSILQTIGFHNNTVYNHYRSFDIPITVGYEFGDEDLKFGINAGVVVNLSSWYQGVILDSSLATVALDKSGNSVYKTNIGMGLYGSFSVVKRLSDDMHVFVEPYFRYNLSNMTTAQSKYNQKFSLGGLSIGLRLNLNRK